MTFFIRKILSRPAAFDVFVFFFVRHRETPALRACARRIFFDYLALNNVYGSLHCAGIVLYMREIRHVKC